MTTPTVKFLAGNEACAEGAIAAGCRFFAGYPISPSSEIMEKMSGFLPKVGGKFMQMEDELASMGAIIGASLAGAKPMTATSGPGFSLMQENLGFAAMAEVPCVVVNAMRGGPSTGNPTGPSQSDILQCRWGTHGDHPAVVLSPTTIQEVFSATIDCFNFAELLRTPVILAMDAIVAHMRERIEVPPASEITIIDRKKPDFHPGDTYYPFETTEDLVPPMMNFGEGARYHVTGLNHDKTGFPTGKPDLLESGGRRIMDKIDKHLDEILLFEHFQTEDAQTLVVAYGSTARSAKRAVIQARERGMKAGLFRPTTIYPLAEKEILKAAAHADKIVVPEMNLGQYVLEIERIVGKEVPTVRINSVDGEPIPPAKILSTILGD